MWGQLFLENFGGFWFSNVISTKIGVFKNLLPLSPPHKIGKKNSLIVIVFYSNSKQCYEISILGTIFFFYDEQNLFMQLTCSHLTIDIKMTLQVDWKLHTW
jgi:hypothetical protein